MLVRLHVRTLRHLGAAVAGLAAATGASGCASVKRNDNPNVIAGKVAFVGRCGSCHTLSRAQTKGIIGPNLDVAFRQDVSDGLARDAIQGVVHDQILNPNPNGAMPRGLARGSLVDDIATYVADTVDRSGQDSGLLATAVRAPGAGRPAVEAKGSLEIDADPSGQLAYVTTKASATAGAVTIVMKNMAAVGHNIAVQEGAAGPVLGAGPVVAGGATSTVHVTLKAGTYTYFCQVPGHRAAGMQGTITVK